MVHDQDNRLFFSMVDRPTRNNRRIPAASSADTSAVCRQATHWRLLPISVMLLLGTLVFVFGWQDYLSFDALKEHRQWLLHWRDTAPIISVVVFSVVYVAVVALSLPGAVWMSIIAGFLFGPVVGSIYVVIAATGGAVLLFLAARYACAERLRRRACGAIARMEAGFRENALNYLLFLRLVPIFPFWLVNLVPAFLGVPLRTFVLGTLIGIIPGSIVYCTVGSGVGAVLDAGGEPDLELILSPPILLPLVGLALLSLVPVLWKVRQRRRAEPRRSCGSRR